MNVTCEAFTVAAEDLALGFTPSPGRDDLLAHASTCAACGARLRELAAVVDSLLELAPEVEPPVGFEARAVARMGATPASEPVRTAKRRTVAAGIAGVAAAALVAVGIGVTVANRTADDPRETAAADVVSRSGDPIGRVELVASPSPKVVVLLEDDGWPGVWVCELQDDDGAWVEIGRWTADEATGGAWAATIDAELLDATRMRITSARGAVIATSSPLAPS